MLTLDTVEFQARRRDYIGRCTELSAIQPCSLSLRGERLLDVIAQAGGPRYSAIETDVRIIRGQIAAAIPLQQVLANLRNTLDETIGRDLYEIYKEAASAVAAECGAIFVPQPDDTRTGIFTKAQYRITKEVRDDRHANVDFGRKVLAQMKAEMAAARP